MRVLKFLFLLNCLAQPLFAEDKSEENIKVHGGRLFLEPGSTTVIGSEQLEYRQACAGRYDQALAEGRATLPASSILGASVSYTLLQNYEFHTTADYVTNQRP